MPLQLKIKWFKYVKTTFMNTPFIIKKDWLFVVFGPDLGKVGNNRNMQGFVESFTLCQHFTNLSHGLFSGSLLQSDLTSVYFKYNVKVQSKDLATIFFYIYIFKLWPGFCCNTESISLTGIWCLVVTLQLLAMVWLVETCKKSNFLREKQCSKV